MARHKILTYDEEIDGYICQKICVMQSLGFKNVSKADALRVIIQENNEANLRFIRKPKTKKGVMFL